MQFNTLKLFKKKLICDDDIVILGVKNFTADQKIEDFILNLNLYQYVHDRYAETKNKYVDYRVDVSKIYINYIRTNGTFKDKFKLMKGVVYVDTLKPRRFWGDWYYNMLNMNYDLYRKFNKKPIYYRWYITTELGKWCHSSACPSCTFFNPLYPDYKDVVKFYPFLSNKRIN